MTNETDEDFPPKERSIWFAVFVTECVVIFIFNAFTLIAFVRNRHLRRRSTHLIINLTVADLLLGPVEIYKWQNKPSQGFSWREFLILTSKMIFFAASQFNLTLISLERLHATLYPFRHSLFSNWEYFKIITGGWVLALFLSFAMALLELLYKPVAVRYASASFTFIPLLILTVSCATIIVNVRNNPYSHHAGSLLLAERKLSVTLFIVTVASILVFLPWSIYRTIQDSVSIYTSVEIHKHIQGKLSLLYYANSVVNPIIFVIRLKEFRKAVKELICDKNPESTSV